MRVNKERPACCIPITGLVRYAVISEAKQVFQSQAEMCEWRLDYFSGHKSEVFDIIPQLKEILGDKKLIVTLRTTEEGGEEGGERYEYFPLIREIIEQNIADYVDVEIRRGEEEVKELIRGRKNDGHIRIIGSCHDFQGMPSMDEILGILNKAVELGLDVAKYAGMALSDDDADTLLRATGAFFEENPDMPVITMAMGKSGGVTRLYGGLYGSRVTFATIEGASAPGQRKLSEVTRIFDRLYSHPGHVFLIGFMGTGKTTVAREVSELYDLPEVDTDSLIETRCKRKIARIFEEDGERIFRMIETETLDDLGEWERAIVSCGGGVALKEINVRKLRAMGTVVWLTASAETIYKRVRGGTTRPLLAGNMSVEYIEELMRKRLPAYEAAADVTVATDKRDVQDIAREVMEKSRDFSCK